MELFTKEQLDLLEQQWRSDTELLDVADEGRLIQHARELLRLMSERPPRPEPRTFTNRIRESDFWTGSASDAGRVEENMRQEGYECVSSIPVIWDKSESSCQIHVHMHFRKP